MYCFITFIFSLYFRQENAELNCYPKKIKILDEDLVCIYKHLPCHYRTNACSLILCEGYATAYFNNERNELRFLLLIFVLQQKTTLTTTFLHTYWGYCGKSVACCILYIIKRQKMYHVIACYRPLKAQTR